MKKALIVLAVLVVVAVALLAPKVRFYPSEIAFEVTGNSGAPISVSVGEDGARRVITGVLPLKFTLKAQKNINVDVSKSDETGDITLITPSSKQVTKPENKKISFGLNLKRFKWQDDSWVSIK